MDLGQRRTPGSEVSAVAVLTELLSSSSSAPPSSRKSSFSSTKRTPPLNLLFVHRSVNTWVSGRLSLSRSRLSFSFRFYVMPAARPRISGGKNCDVRVVISHLPIYLLCRSRGMLERLEPALHLPSRPPSRASRTLNLTTPASHPQTNGTRYWLFGVYRRQFLYGT